MKNQEEAFLDMAIKYKKEYNTTSWWKFRKRIGLKKSWYSARDCMVRYGK